MLIAFGGPTAMEEVRPFLANVLRGRRVPPERIEEVVRHYEVIGGRSPLNELTFRQAEAMGKLLRAEGSPLPVYVGMRNWHPSLHETLAEIAQSGARRVIALILSPQQNDAGWERYKRDVADACAALTSAPSVEFAAGWHAHPLFIEAVSGRVRDALQVIPPSHRTAARAVFTAHSIPAAMAAGSPYVAQLSQAASLVAASVGLSSYGVAYQSRSGNPREPWLEPDICRVVREEAARGTSHLVVVPLGFVCDHVEVLYDLDVEAKGVAEAHGLHFIRAQTVNDHTSFIRMLADVARSHVGKQSSRDGCVGGRTR